MVAACQRASKANKLKLAARGLCPIHSVITYGLVVARMLSNVIRELSPTVRTSTATGLKDEMIDEVREQEE